MQELKQAYRCEYCGKIYLRKSACLLHEIHLCLRNPENRPLCYDCKHYNPCFFDNEKEAITCYGDTPWGGEFKYKIHFSPNKCELQNFKLFNNIKLSDEKTTALYEAGYEAMPLPKDGCEYFEESEPF